MKLRYGIAGAVLILALAVGGIATAIGGGETGSDGPTGTATHSESFVGLTIYEATALAEDEDRPWRIGRQDDEVFVLTDDLVPGRVTFEIDDGTVTSAIIEHPSTSSPNDAIAEDPARAGLIAAAVKQLLTVDNSFGGVDVFADIRVAAVIGADPDQPLQGLDLEMIAAALSELGAVSYVDDAEAEIKALFEAPLTGVAVVSVERILILDDRAEVELRLWCGSLCGVFLTYEAAPQDGGLDITGITGPIAMS